MSSGKGHVVLGVIVGLLYPGGALATATGKPEPARLTAAQIVQKHLAARGGAQAWQKVQSMAWNGTMEVGFGDSVARSEGFVSTAAKRGKGPRAPSATEGKDANRKQVALPFSVEMKRPGRERSELEFAGKTAVQVYDGKNGWLLRPYLNRDDWEPFSAEQAKAQRQDEWGLGGPLMNAAAQGTKVELASVERVEGRDAYKLKLTHKGGEVQHLWIDAKSFLDVKVEGTPRRMDGKLRSVFVTARDFRPVKGLLVPFVLETAVDGTAGTHKMVIEKVALNPPLADGRFAKPKT